MPSAGWISGPRESIMKVDGIGIHPGAVEAAVGTIVRGIGASGSVMTVCPGTHAALELVSEYERNEW